VVFNSDLAYIAQLAYTGKIRKVKRVNKKELLDGVKALYFST